MLSAKERENKSRKKSIILVSVTGVCPALSLMYIIFGDLKTTVVVRDLRNVRVNSGVEERIAHTLNYFRQLCLFCSGYGYREPLYSDSWSIAFLVVTMT